MDYSQFLFMPQEVGLLLVFLLVFIYDTFMPSRMGKHLPLFATILTAIYTVCAFFPCPDSWGMAFGGMFESNPATWVMKIILNIGVLLVMLQSVKWTNDDFVSVRRGEFYELILLTLFGMMLMISARHFLLFVIGLETASLPIAALAAFEKRYYESHEAAAKYVFTAVFSSAIFMLGISFVYGMSGSLYFQDIATSVMGKSPLLILAVAFVIAGVGYKLSLVPFHQWTADVYQGAPTAVTSYLSVISKGAAAFAFLVILVQVFGAVYAQVWQWMLYGIIILTITIGNLFAMRQRNLKRFLAYSSISQAGYIMLGVIAANQVGMTSMIYYVLVYIFSNLAAFGVIAVIERATGRVTMDDYNGLFKTNPWLAFTMMLAMFSLGGIPPFAGFFSKFFIFVGACHTGSVAIYVLVFIALVNTIISLYYYLLVVKAMFLRQDDCVIPYIDSHWTEELALTICVMGIMAVGVASGIYTFLSRVTDTVAPMFSMIG